MKGNMDIYKDVFTGQTLCSHPSCHWATGGGYAGVVAKYTDKNGTPCCFEHLDEAGKEEITEATLRIN